MALPTEEWAAALNLCRKTALMLLYRVVDLCLQPGLGVIHFETEALKQHFQVRRIVQIMNHCLVMDRAKCLYYMVHDLTSKRGLGWYSEKDKSLYSGQKNPIQPSVNKHYEHLCIQLRRDLDSELLEHYFQLLKPAYVDHKSGKLIFCEGEESIHAKTGEALKDMNLDNRLLDLNDVFEREDGGESAT